MESFEKKDLEENAKKIPDNISAAEVKRIKENIERSDTEKFHLFCRMMRIQKMLEKAIVTHK